MRAVSLAILTYCALAPVAGTRSVSAADSDVMARKNPSRLLGLEP
jgi:hypothetical protein